MKNEKYNKKLTEEEEKDFFEKLKVSYSKSKEDVWQNLAQKIKVKPIEQKKATKIISLNKVSLGIAASIFLLISVGLFARFYTKTIQVEKAEFRTHTLPDNSKIYLNAETQISYRPYWWYFSRTLSLEGEAFFEVEKGSEFTVYSEKGSTAVLGTKFNILARDEEYQVYCTEGKVGVSNDKNTKIVLKKGDLGKLSQNGSFTKIIQKDFSKEEILAWRLKKFTYNNTPLQKVFKDLERHYDVKIVWNYRNSQQLYTGLFSRTVSVEEALDIICSTFDLQFKKRKQGTYVIVQK